jgi:heterodisulfide reductase subunit C
MAEAEALETRTFLDEVIEATPGGERLRSCLQCGTCGGSCPNGADMEYTPRELFALIVAGERERVLGDDSVWFCVSCYACTARCPKQIPVTEVMYTLKRLAAKERRTTGVGTDAVALAKEFRYFVDRYGRSFELGLATRFYLLHKPLSILGLGPLGLRMFTHGRMDLTPNKIENLAELRAILEKARELGGGRT